MHRKLAGALAVAVLALAAGACGEEAKPLTTEQLDAQASAVCRDVRRQMLALQASATEATLRRSLQRAADVLSDGVERLDALEPPERLADAYARLVAWKAAQRDAAQALAEAPSRRLSGRAARAVDAHVDPVGRAARAAGVPACA